MRKRSYLATELRTTVWTLAHYSECSGVALGLGIGLVLAAFLSRHDVRGFRWGRWGKAGSGTTVETMPRGISELEKTKSMSNARCNSG